jgi:hypothetical protein
MFRSFLKSMQTKSQDAQNPGLWVNGNRMPMQEGKGSMDKVIDPMQEANQTAKKTLDSESEIQEKAKTANVSTDSWASMAAQHISTQSTKPATDSTPAPAGSDGY